MTLIVPTGLNLNISLLITNDSDLIHEENLRKFQDYHGDFFDILHIWGKNKFVNRTKRRALVKSLSSFRPISNSKPLLPKTDLEEVALMEAGDLLQERATRILKGLSIESKKQIRTDLLSSSDESPVEDEFYIIRRSIALLITDSEDNLKTESLRLIFHDNPTLFNELDRFGNSMFSYPSEIRNLFRSLSCPFSGNLDNITHPPLSHKERERFLEVCSSLENFTGTLLKSIPKRDKHIMRNTLFIVFSKLPREDTDLSQKNSLIREPKISIDPPSSEGRKDDSDKIRLELIPMELITEVGKVMTFGAKKYSDRNWERGMSYSRVFGACVRHLCAWWNPLVPDTDDETGLSHLSHAACCIAFLVSYECRGQGEKDNVVK